MSTARKRVGWSETHAILGLLHIEVYCFLQKYPQNLAWNFCSVRDIVRFDISKTFILLLTQVSIFDVLLTVYLSI